jgi:hypothetical protein
VFFVSISKANSVTLKFQVTQHSRDAEAPPLSNSLLSTRGFQPRVEISFLFW